MQSQIERTRIISKDALLKDYAAMFLGELNRVGRYYKDLLPQIRKTIFAKNDNLAPYYSSAFALWRLEFLFRAKRLDRAWKAFRYPLLLISRYIIEQEKGLDRGARLGDAYCRSVDSYFADVERAADLFTRANAVVDEIISAIGADYSKRVAKTREFKDRVDERFAIAPAS